MSISVIIPAGGSSLRFQKSQPKGQKKVPSKLFFQLQGEPLLVKTVDVFARRKEVSKVVVSMPKGTEGSFNQWAKEKGWKGVIWAQGGATRAKSVANGFKKCSRQAKWVLVHDGARPFVTDKALTKLLKRSEKTKADALVLGSRVTSTIKRTAVRGKKVLETVNRDELVEAQTPQMVRASFFRQKLGKCDFQETDEANLVEEQGGEVEIVLSDDWNPKITNYADYELARAVVKEKDRVSYRVGVGFDTHRLVEKKKFKLGGVLIPSKKGPVAHSDGDALLHAITDSILGALGKSDIGDLFPDKDPALKGVDSAKILKAVWQKPYGEGWRIVNLDTVVQLEVPKLGERKAKIAKKLASLLKCDVSQIAVKAKTFEGVGLGGEGSLIQCHAHVMITRELGE